MGHQGVFEGEDNEERVYSPVCVLLSKNVLEVSTVIEANVPSVIWAELSLRPLYLWTLEKFEINFSQ